ncbi:uncharacterized protein LOC111257232 [Setaria italica]|uniref:uncharacterized protein LOC111257232 n=1 Tax=Setaria italica TaxID=4555 RepID=UPI000BE4F7B9|nr:uncharacterized protein LOC111257232 [Setaria italica]
MVHFKTAKTSRARFSVGDQAKLESKNRRSWSGDVTVVEDDVIQLWTILQIRVPSARERKIVLKPSNNVPVMVNPAGSLHGFSSQAEMRDSTKDSGSKETSIRVGFSQVGRILVEMGLRSIDVQVVAINDPSMTLDRMVEIWKSTNIRIAKKDHQTSVFEKRYYAKDTSVKGDKKIKINALLEQMEVTVFDRYVDVDDSSVDLKVTLEKAGCYSSTNRIATRRLRIDSEESLAGVWILPTACRWEAVDWS